MPWPPWSQQGQMLPRAGPSAWGAHAACAGPGRHDRQRMLRCKVCFGLNVHGNLNVTGEQSLGPWQPANAVLSVCIPLAFGEEKKCGGGLPEDPLADHLWPQAAARQSCAVEGLALPLGSGSTGAPAWAALVQSLLDVAIGAGRCRPHGTSPGWNGAGVGPPCCGHAGDREAAMWVVSTSESSGLCVSHIKYATGHCIS